MLCENINIRKIGREALVLDASQDVYLDVQRTVSTYIHVILPACWSYPQHKHSFEKLANSYTRQNQQKNKNLIEEEIESCEKSRNV